jgi:FtsH-binding integral membrane protein
MPFLLLAFKSVDLYFSQNKKIPLIITTFLMIMTSYYFSVFGIISIGVYTLSKILKNKKFNWRPLGSIIYLVSIAILLSAVLLVPTIYAISTGRADTSTTSISLLSLFSLKTNYNYTFYSSYYSWGITFIYIVAIVNAFLSKKKDQIFLSIIMTLIIIFPIFSYLLNA